MPVVTTNGIPAEIRSGDTAIFTVAAPSDYPAGTWTLTFDIMLNGTAIAQTTATTSGSDYLVTIASTTTDDWAPGIYQYAAFVTSSGQRATIYSGTIRILENVAVTRTATVAESLLTKVETALSSLMSGTNQSVSFNGQTFTKKDLAQLITIRDRLKAEVLAERAQLSGTNRITIRPRFFT